MQMLLTTYEVHALYDYVRTAMHFGKTMKHFHFSICIIVKEPPFKKLDTNNGFLMGICQPHSFNDAPPRYMKENNWSMFGFHSGLVPFRLIDYQPGIRSLPSRLGYNIWSTLFCQFYLRAEWHRLRPFRTFTWATAQSCRVSCVGFIS